VYETNFLDWYERWLDEIIAGYDISWFGTKLPGEEKALIEAYQSTNSDEEKLEARYGKSTDADRYIEVIRRGFAQFDDKDIMQRVGYFFHDHGATDIRDFQHYLCSSDPMIQRDALYATRDCNNKAEYDDGVTPNSNELIALYRTTAHF